MIKLELEKDIQLLKSVARTGFITEKLLKYTNVSLKRFKLHVNYGNFEKKGTYLLYGSLSNVYILSDISKKRIKSEFLINPYKSDVTQLEHDYCLSMIYHSLPLMCKESWITETELKIRYPYAATTTDGLFLDADGKKIGVEIISPTYSKKNISLKMNFIKHYCDDYIMIHTHND